MGAGLESNSGMDFPYRSQTQNQLLVYQWTATFTSGMSAAVQCSGGCPGEVARPDSPRTGLQMRLLFCR